MHLSSSKYDTDETMRLYKCNDDEVYSAQTNICVMMIYTEMLVH